MLDPHPDLTSSVVLGLGWVYFLLFVLNFAWTLREYRRDQHFNLPKFFGGQAVPSSAPWAVYAVMLGVIAATHFTGYSNPDSFLFRMPAFFKNFVDERFANPVAFFLASVIGYGLMIYLREWWTRPTVAWALLNVAFVFTSLSMTDWDFRQIVGKPDNVPIVAMLFICAFFTWIYFSRAVDNDRRVAEGKPLREVERQKKILVWPDLVYTELICMIAVASVLVIWGIVLQAPLEEPASSVKTPNPSKAPWYFLGLQEMLVYYDPWLAGVVFPTLILVGLMAIPYIDFNRQGNGYYTFKERSFSVSVFLFGFLPLWVAMIVLGTFLRGPNWNFFGIYEYWDVHKLEALNNVNLSEYFWLEWLGVGMPTASSTAGVLQQVGTILLRESVGFIVIIAYLVALPPLMAATVFRKYFQKMGFLRFMVFANLALFMAALPLKMVLRWAFNLKYLVAIPEWFFNI